MSRLVWIVNLKISKHKDTLKNVFPKFFTQKYPLAPKIEDAAEALIQENIQQPDPVDDKK